MNNLSRRRFIAASLAALAVRPGVAAVPARPDVVVVGAGAAGLAATRTLLESGVTVVLVEASTRIGGRAYTDHETFGIPYDRGAYWLHHGSQNPFVKYGKTNGFDIYPAPENYRLYSHSGQAVGPHELDEFWNSHNQIIKAISKAGKANLDVAASEVIHHITGRWVHTAKLFEGPWSMAKDFEDFSTVDWWNSEDGVDNFCKDGYGTLVTHYGRGVNALLQTPVTRINWGGNGIKLQTTKGELKPKAVIITVSTGVLASGSIEFSPALPLEKRESFESISMGTYERVALHFSRDVVGMGADGYLLFEVGSDQKGFATLTNASDSGLMYCDIGGNWARELQRESEVARINYALDRFKLMFGNAVARDFLHGATSAWAVDPLTRGSYASANPGQYAMRKILRQPVADRVFFAGEACHQSMWGTVHGAHLSGVATARSLLKILG